MNLEEELRQLEIATSREPSASAAELNLDAETAELREGWRVLTKALDANSGTFDEGALISKLQRERATPAIATGTNRLGNGWMVVGLLGGTLAASLLIVVAIGSGWFAQRPVAKPVEKPIPKENGVAVEKIGGASQYDPTTPSWDDSLDSQISVAAAQMQTMQKPALPLDASISTLNYQLQQMAQDLDEGAL
jgi:hypothetical protein